jgi:hypothetical protein
LEVFIVLIDEQQGSDLLEPIAWWHAAVRRPRQRRTQQPASMAKQLPTDCHHSVPPMEIHRRACVTRRHEG